MTKREAEEPKAKPEPNPYLTAHGYSHYGPANIKDIEYGQTGIKYLSKREAEDTEVKPEPPSSHLLALGKCNENFGLS